MVSHTISKRFGPSEPWAIHALDLRLEQGQVLGLIGPVGAGKTTLVRLAAGLIDPDEGELEVFGVPPWADEARARLGLVPESPEFPPLLRPAEVMDYCGRLLGLGAGERAQRSVEALEWAGLAEERRSTGRLPAGRKKRLGIAQALLGSPELLILDGPGSGLDTSERLALRQLIRALARGGSAVLICSSELDELVEVCEQVVLLDSGRAVAQGPLRQVLPAGRSLEQVFAELRASRRLAAQAVDTPWFGSRPPAGVPEGAGAVAEVGAPG